MDTKKEFDFTPDFFNSFDLTRDEILKPILSMNNFSMILENSLVESEPLPFVGHIEEIAEYQKQSLEILKTISENTASLKVLVDLISESTENQAIILEILNDILTIAKANNKEEADTLFKKVFEKISKSVTTAESMGKIIVCAKTIYELVVAKFPQ